jgi:hypothetical protein
MKLYHATYLAYHDSIMEKGLNGCGQKNYTDSVLGVTYLASDFDEALSYAETSELAPDDVIDEIIVFEINSETLDSQLLFADRNVVDGDSTFEYHGVIPYNLLKVVEE